MGDRPDVTVIREWVTKGQMTSGTFGQRRVEALLDYIGEIEAERDRLLNGWLPLQEHGAAAEAKVQKLREALDPLLSANADLRRELHPDKGCGYTTYRRVWRASLDAEVGILGALDATVVAPAEPNVTPK